MAKSVQREITYTITERKQITMQILNNAGFKSFFSIHELNVLD